MKYDFPDNQNEILPNIPGLKAAEEIALSEFEGFLKAEIQQTESLTPRTKFNVSYTLRIHKLAPGHLYSFAGKYRDVNISKGGFAFSAARFYRKQWPHLRARFYQIFHTNTKPKMNW